MTDQPMEEPVVPEPSRYVIEVTLVGDEQNGAYVHLVEGPEDELDHLVEDLRANDEITVASSRAVFVSVADFRATESNLLADPNEGE